MRGRIRHLRRDERGVTLIIVGAGFMALLAATTLAIDVGMFMMARSQAQNSADSGALAGAVALVFNDFNNRSASGPAVQSALGGARANQVVAGTVSVTPADVTFPTGPTGQNNRVHVTVRRTAQRNNPVPTLIGPIFGAKPPNSANRIGMMIRAISAERRLVMIRNMNVMTMAKPRKVSMGILQA